MQVFLPCPDNLEKSAQSLDDLRLNKQITEINQILLTYVNGCGGHSEHPVNKWYNNPKGTDFLLTYLEELLSEHSERFNKTHMGKFTRDGFVDYFYPNQANVFYQVRQKDFKPAYIKGQRNKDQIITTENVGELYQKLLCDKWENDKVEPKWTNRDKPEFYRRRILNRYE